jgi:hypothetical protein
MRATRDLWVVRCGLLGLLTWLGLLSPAAAAVTPLPLAGPNAPSVVVWNAGDSYSDGPLSDARLDQPVRFWRTAVRVTDVAQGIQQQTGVEVRFWPEDDVNRRVRMNLYLNPKTPPGLRELLVQLGWVLDCNLTCSDTEPRVYYLLGSGNTTSSVVALLRQARSEQEASAETATVTRRADMLVWLNRYQAALGLPRKEAVAQYRGVDDRLVLALVVPWRRAALQLLLSLPNGDLQQFLDGESLTAPYSDLSAQQRASLSAALKLSALPKASRIAFSQWVLKLVVGDEPDDSPRIRLQTDTMLIEKPSSPLSSHERVGVRRWLGERVSAEEESRLADEAGEEWRRNEQRTEESLQQEAAQRLAVAELSAEARAQLMGATLAWRPEQSYTLWQVQEAAAALTGLNVVSDSLCQPAQPIGELDTLDPEYQREERTWDARMHQLLEAYPDIGNGEAAPKEAREEWNALLKAYRAPHDFALMHWLALMCRDLGDGSALWVERGGTPEGSQWGSRGSFLRFRSTYRRFLPGLLLSDEVLAELQAVASPATGTDSSGHPSPSPGRNLDPKEATRLLALADDLQWRVARNLVYEDPTTPLGLTRQEALRSLSGTLATGVDVLRLLATFTPGQWEQLTTTGLNCQRDLSAAQQSLPAVREALRDLGGSRELPSPLSLADVTLVAVPVPADESHDPGSEIMFTSAGGGMGIIVAEPASKAPTPLPHLVPAPEPEGNQ